MDRRSKNPAASTVGNERPLERQEPSKFTSGMGRRSKNPAASAVDNERPLFKGHRRANFPRTISRGLFPEVEFPSEFQAASAADKAAIYRVSIHISTPDQASKLTSTEVFYLGGV